MGCSFVTISSTCDSRCITLVVSLLKIVMLFATIYSGYMGFSFVTIYSSECFMLPDFPIIMV